MIVIDPEWDLGYWSWILFFSIAQQPTIHHHQVKGLSPSDWTSRWSLIGRGTPSLATIFPMVVKTLEYPALLSNAAVIHEQTLQHQKALRASELGSREVKRVTTLHRLDIQSNQTQHWGWFLNIHWSDATCYHESWTTDHHGKLRVQTHPPNCHGSPLQASCCLPGQGPPNELRFHQKNRSLDYRRYIAGHHGFRSSRNNLFPKINCLSNKFESEQSANGNLSFCWAGPWKNERVCLFGGTPVQFSNNHFTMKKNRRSSRLGANQQPVSMPKFWPTVTLTNKVRDKQSHGHRFDNSWPFHSLSRIILILLYTLFFGGPHQFYSPLFKFSKIPILFGRTPGFCWWLGRPVNAQFHTCKTAANFCFFSVFSRKYRVFSASCLGWGTLHVGGVGWGGVGHDNVMYACVTCTTPRYATSMCTCCPHVLLRWPRCQHVCTLHGGGVGWGMITSCTLA